MMTDWQMQATRPRSFCAGDVRMQLTMQVTTVVGDATVVADKYLTKLDDQALAAAEEGSA